MHLISALRGLSWPLVRFFITASAFAGCSGSDQVGSASTGAAPSVGGNSAAGAPATAAGANAAGNSGNSGSSGSGSALGGSSDTTNRGADAGGTGSAAGGLGVGGSAGVAGTGGTAAGSGSSGPPNFYATAPNLVEVWVNGTSVGQSTSAGALLSAAAKLKLGAANIIAVRASKGSAAKPFLHAEMDGAFGKAGTSTRWRAKAAATADELTGSAWAASDFDDSSWSAASDAKVAPTAPELVNGPAHGIWTTNGSGATALFRTRIYLPADWSADKPYGFGSAVTGGAGGTVVTVKTSEELAQAVSGDAAKIIQVTGTLDFTGKEGTSSNTCCDAVTCAKGGGQIITDDLGACSGKATFACSYDTAGTKPLKVGSNKTIVGVGASATIKGKGFDLTGNVSNIIIRNLTITNLNPQVVWGGDAITIRGASKVWIDHNRISLIGRQFLVSGFDPATEVTFSYNELDGNTPYSSNCDGTHYWTMLFAGSENTMTLMGNWIHHTSGRGPHAGGTSPIAQHVYAQFANDYYENVTGHAADPAENANLFYEGSYFQSVKTPFVTTDGGFSYAPVTSNLSSTSAACSSAVGRSCVANANSASATFPLDSPALTAMSAHQKSLVTPYPASEVPSCVPYLAGPGHI